MLIKSIGNREWCICNLRGFLLFISLIQSELAHGEKALLDLEY